MNGMRGSTRRELGDLAVTAVLAAGLLFATAAAGAAGRAQGSDASDAGGSHVERAAECRAESAPCSDGSPVHVRLTMEPRTGVCLA